MTTQSQEIREIRQEMKELAALVKDAVNDSPSNVIGFDRRELRQMAKRAGKSMRSYLDHKAQQADDMRQACEDTITGHPFTSVLGAVAGGMLLGAFLGRK